jgi:hypothetical protein
MTVLGRLFLAAALAATAEAHGGLAFPPPRNNFGNVAPTNLTYQPGSHIPNWQGGSCAGDMCLWFNEGCFIGCESCSSEIPVVPGTTGEVPDRFSAWLALSRSPLPVDWVALSLCALAAGCGTHSAKA